MNGRSKSKHLEKHLKNCKSNIIVTSHWTNQKGGLLRRFKKSFAKIGWPSDDGPWKRWLLFNMASYLLLVDEILHRLIGSLSHYLQGFIHPRWCRTSSIETPKNLKPLAVGFLSFVFQPCIPISTIQVFLSEIQPLIHPCGVWIIA